MEGLDLDAILDDSQIESLFGESSEENEKTESEEDSTEDQDKDKNQEEITEVDPDSMFEEKPESVGNERNSKDEEDTTSTENSGSPDFFSSIANAFVEEGIFPDLADDEVKNIKSAKDLREAIDNQIKAGLDEQQQRVLEALNNNVEVSKIRQYENLLGYLDNLSKADIEAENEEGENIRKRLLYQDYINRGFSKERATKAVNRAIDNGTDVEDALEALESNKVFFKDEYSNLLNEAKEERRQVEKEREEKAKRLKKSMLEDDVKLFGDVEITDKMRQKAFDAISKPIYRDPETGEYYTAVQKYELDNSEEFLAKIGFIYAITDGFKTIDGLVNKKVKKEVKKGFSDLENKLNTTKRDSFGNLRFTSGASSEDSILSSGLKLDL